MFYYFHVSMYSIWKHNEMSCKTHYISAALTTQLNNTESLLDYRLPDYFIYIFTLTVLKLSETTKFSIHLID